ncbi:hypothetical protein KAR91_29235, partial [Candidatus Pacearchaeota archaeon]|nr:hypothetical protein [Candidatus Pacearchaeota archaeon]
MTDRSKIQDLLSDQLTELQSIASGFPNDREYTATFYLSPDGDNSDGLTWATAFNTLAAVHNLASADVNAFTLVLCAPATYDVNIAGSFDITKQLHIIGKSRANTIFENNNALATGVFTVTTAFCMMDKMQVSSGLGNFGVLFTPTNSGFRMFDSFINGTINTSANSLLEFNNASNCRIEDTYIVGNPLSITMIGIDLNTTSYGCTFMNCAIGYCDVGINLDNTFNTFCVFSNPEILYCTIGVSIGG